LLTFKDIPYFLLNSINIAYDQIFKELTIPVDFKYREKVFNVVHFPGLNDTLTLLVSFNKATYQKSFAADISFYDWAIFIDSLLDDVNFSNPLRVNSIS
jgi:hypothetical protein